MRHITDLKLVSKDIARGLLALKSRIEAARIPSSRVDESFTMATWNIREFGKKARSQAAIHYIAEILGQFDLVGVVELRDDLRDLHRVLEVLGPYWRAVYSDAVMDDGGNRERVAYVYDKRQIAFNGMASAAFGRRRKEDTEWIPEINWWRPPFIASFKSGNFDFVVLTTHIRWGGSAKERLPELQAIADWVSDKQALLGAGRRSWDEPDIFVMGERADLKDLHLHDLRHTAATRLARKSGNALLVKALTGHKTDVMVARYIHINADDVVEFLHKEPAVAAPDATLAFSEEQVQALVAKAVKDALARAMATTQASAPMTQPAQASTHRFAGANVIAFRRAAS